MPDDRKEARALDALNAHLISQRLATLSPPPRVEVFDQLDSTNAYLLAQPVSNTPFVCLAEFQTAGRGRQGRSWFSPHASGLCLSLKISGLPPEGLSLVLGLAAARVLRDLGVTGLGVKWPNDLWRDGRKLGGILVESRMAQPPGWVAGIGLNVTPPDDFSAPGTPWSRTDKLPVSRNELAARLVIAWLGDTARLQNKGFPAFRETWEKWDVLRDKPVRVETSQEEWTGIARGVDAHGALRVETEAGERLAHGGDAHLRVD